MEKEINLLKQVENLHKSQEDKSSKASEVNIQNKLTQKRQKIELLKTKLTTVESNLDKIKKVDTLKILFFFLIVYCI